MRRTSSKSLAFASAASALALFAALQVGPSEAAPAPSQAAPLLRPAAKIVKRLPAGHDELVFSGENASRTWQVYLSPTEAARISSFQLGMLNSAVVLPERSFLKLTINGRIVSILPVRNADKMGSYQVKVPPGLLVSGANAVQVGVALSHRVDCSVKATYELWATLDPNQTGFLVDGGAPNSVRSLDELAADPLDADGATRIHLRMPDNADAAQVGRAGRLVNALVRRAGLMRPIVDVSADVGQGPGFDIVLARGAPAEDVLRTIRILGREDGVTLGRDLASDRLVLLMSANDDADLDGMIAALDRSAPAAKTRAARGGVDIDEGITKNFAQLGFSSEPFGGRHYLSSVDINLPSDFYAANDDKGRVWLDGAHSGSLDANAELIFRVNGTIVSTMPLAEGREEQFSRKQVNLPLRYFHPGHNEVAIEGLVTSPADQQCDVVNMPHEARLVLSGSSELEIPHFARMATVPQIPSAISTLAQSSRGLRPQLYLAGLDPKSIGAALTVLANMAASVGPIDTPVIHLDPPSQGDVPGIVIGSLDQLPPMLSSPLRAVTKAPMTLSEASDADPAAPLEAASATMTTGDAAPVVRKSPKSSMMAAFDSAAALWRQSKARALGKDRLAEPLQLAPHYLVVGAVNPSARSQAGSSRLPQFASNASQWLVVAGQDADGSASGINRLVVDGQWSDLAGQVTALDIDTGRIQSLQPSRPAYVLPSRVVLSDIRPILGGILSDNILLSLAGLFILMTVLGLSTHAIVRRAGAR